MLDASGKPARGLLEGNIHMIGNFDQCKGISHVITEGPREGSAIAGSYCHVQFVIPMEHLPPVPGDVRLNLDVQTDKQTHTRSRAYTIGLDQSLHQFSHND